MTTNDHNNTLAGIYLVVGSVLFLILISFPWTIGPDLRRPDQMPLKIIIIGVLLLGSVLMLSTTIAMWKQKPIGRKLAMFSAMLLMLIFWPAGIYSWWFIHSDGARQLYDAKDD